MQVKIKLLIVKITLHKAYYLKYNAEKSTKFAFKQLINPAVLKFKL